MCIRVCYIIKQDNSWSLVTPKNVASFSYQGDDDEGLFFITNYEAPNYRLVKMLFSGEMIDIIPESQFALKNVSIQEDFIIADSINANMNSLIKFYSLEGGELDHIIPNEIQGTLSSFSIQNEKLRFSVSGFTTPTRYVDLNLETQEFNIVWEDKVSNFNPSDYQETFAYYDSKDGTKIPLTYFHRKDTSINANTPVFLYGYGGYIVSFGLILFAFTTILGWSYYGERCASYLFGIRIIFIYRIFWIIAIFTGAIIKLEIVWIFADIANGLMALPNLIALLLLSPIIFIKTKDYFKKYNG